jgi:hypothetical protein
VERHFGADELHGPVRIKCAKAANYKGGDLQFVAEDYHDGVLGEESGLGDDWLDGFLVDDDWAGPLAFLWRARFYSCVESYKTKKQKKQWKYQQLKRRSHEDQTRSCQTGASRHTESSPAEGLERVEYIFSTLAHASSTGKNFSATPWASCGKQQS